MTAYYRWINKESPDLQEALVKNKLQYTDRGNPSKKAFWVFQIEKDYYKPGGNLSAEAVLVKITLTEAGKNLIEDSQKWINFEDETNFGESKYPGKVIVKNNEPGARGIGHVLLTTLCKEGVQKIEQASKREYAKALDKNEKEIQWSKWQPKRR